MSAGAPPQTPLGELTALPQTPKLASRGPTSRGREGALLLRGGEGRGEGREGEWALLVFGPFRRPCSKWT